MLSATLRGTSVRVPFGSPFSSKVVVRGHCLVTLFLTFNETLKWLSLLSILMQESYMRRQCSDRYIISPLLPFSPTLISLMVSVDVKHHVYLLLITTFNYPWVTAVNIAASSTGVVPLSSKQPYFTTISHSRFSRFVFLCNRTLKAPRPDPGETLRAKLFLPVHGYTVSLKILAVACRLWLLSFTTGTDGIMNTSQHKIKHENNI